MARYLKGEGDRKNRYVRCKNCHWPVDTWKVRKSDGLGSMNCVIENTPTTSSLDNFAVLDELHYPVALITQFGGDANTLKRDVAVEIKTGCPFCGSGNFM